MYKKVTITTFVIVNRQSSNKKQKGVSRYAEKRVVQKGRHFEVN